MADTSEDDGLAADKPKVGLQALLHYTNHQTVPIINAAPTAQTAAALQAQRAVADLPLPTPSLSPSPLVPATPDNEPMSMNGLQAPLVDIQRGTPDSNSVAPQAGSAGTPELMHDSAFPMPKCKSESASLADRSPSFT